MKGVGFPLQKGVNGYWEFKEDRSLILSDILSLLYTVPGEIPMYPEIGNLLLRLVHEQNTELLREIAKDLAKYTLEFAKEDRVEVLDVSVNGEHDTLKVVYHLRVKDTKEELFAEVEL